MTTDKHPHKLRYKICVSGAAETGHCSPYALERATEIGREVAKHGLVLVTGATTGAPYWAAKGAKEAGGLVIGFSPAVSQEDHIKKFDLPTDYHDFIFYTGYGYSSRNLLLIRSSDAVITVCGRIGTLNEFSIAFEDKKPIGVLRESGGIADTIREILDVAHRGDKNVIFDPDPKQLVSSVVSAIEDRSAAGV